MITAREQQIVVDKAKAAMHQEFEERFQELEKRLAELESPAEASAPKRGRPKAA